MKKTILSLVVSVIISLFCREAKAQLTFSVSPGLSLNSASFGYKMKKCVPFISLQVLSARSVMNETGKRFDAGTGAVVNYKDEYKFSGTIYMPTLGVKYFFKETNKIKAYGLVSFTKFLFSGNIEDDNDPTAQVDLQDRIKSVRVFGGQLGFGAEYFFDDNFSIGGEFGIRLLHAKYKDEYTDEVYDPNTGGYTPSTTTYDYKININPTYGKIALNFYFGKPL
jgi:hypothetical protein